MNRMKQFYKSVGKHLQKRENVTGKNLQKRGKEEVVDLKNWEKGEQPK